MLHGLYPSAQACNLFYLACADLFCYVLLVPSSSSLPSHSSPPPPPLLPSLPLPFFSSPVLLPFSCPPLLPSFSSPSIPHLLPSPPLASLPPHRRPNPLIHNKRTDPRPLPIHKNNASQDYKGCRPIHIAVSTVQLTQTTLRVDPNSAHIEPVTRVTCIGCGDRLGGQSVETKQGYVYEQI